MRILNNSQGSRKNFDILFMKHNKQINDFNDLSLLVLCKDTTFSMSILYMLYSKVHTNSL